jgi:hypothetical protein
MNIVMALGGLVFGIQISKSFENQQVNIPKVKVNFHKFQYQEESLKISFKQPKVFKNKIAAIKTNKKSSIQKQKRVKTKENVIFAKALEKDIQIELEEAVINEEVQISLNNKVYKIDKKFISNKELVEHIEYGKVEIANENWVAFLDSKNIEKNLMALNKYYPVENVIADNEKNNDEKEKDIVDKTSTKLSATIKNKNDELVFYDYSEPVINENLEKEVKPILSRDESLAKKNYVTANVDKVIQRELTTQDSVKLASSAPIKEAIKKHFVENNEDLNKPVPPKPNPVPPVMNTTVLKAIEVNLNSKNISAVNRFNFVPDFDQNFVLESDSYDSSLALDFNVKNDYSVIRGRVDSQGMLVTRVELPLVNNHEQIEVPLFNQQTFFSYLEEKEIQGYGGHLLVDLEETNIVDVDLIAVTKNRNESYEARIFLDENFKETGLDQNFRYALFLNVNPGVVLVKYLNDGGQELQKPTFVLPDELIYEPTKLNEYSNEKVSLSERGSLANNNVPLDIDNNQIIDFYTGQIPERDTINQFSINRNTMFSGYRKYLELNHLESPVIVGYSSSTDLEVPALDYIEKIMNEMDITLERECLVQMNLKKGITNIQLYGEAVNGPLNYEEKYLGNDGYFTDEINGASEKMFLVGMEPGIISLKIEHSDGTNEYFQTFCSEGSYLIEHL